MLKELNESARKRRILVVEDEAINRLMLGNIISKNYDVVYACNGQEALGILNEEKDTLSLILLDLLMPVMDGFTFMGEIRKDEQLKKIPVVVLTSEEDAEVDSIRLGAMDFIRKPYNNPEVILARVERIIELFEDRQLINRVEYDETGLLTRDFFIEYVQQMDSIDKEDRDLIAVNIGRFSLINEIYGRKQGDKILRITADALKDFLAEHQGLACHLDADQFFLYCRKLENTDDLLKIENDVSVNGEIPNTRLRFGILRDSSKETETEKRMNSAVFACNTLRNNFSKNIAFYDQKLHDDEIMADRLLGDMDRALAEREFKVYLQPKFDIRGDKPHIVAAEALARWKHGKLGMISPGQFIPLFEKNGLVRKLDYCIFEETARIIREWKEKYGCAIPVSVNISRVDLYDKSLKEKLLEIIARNGLEIKDINLEVTESVYMDDDDDIIKRIADLRDTGFDIEMDDFGAGFSSLNMLYSMPIDALKLDMKFARTIDTDRKQYYVVKCIVDFAGYLGVKTICEGVENKEQYEAMKQAGCDLVQGYYFSKPLPEEEFETYIKELKEGLC
ncbi:MAG: EAL domain-containing protein [Erysipelotrichaceae bacterium]|nr:EAL domain-containing protein [Erysipelotrichaceae bacterium]